MNYFELNSSAAQHSPDNFVHYCNCLMLMTILISTLTVAFSVAGNATDVLDTGRTTLQDVQSILPDVQNIVYLVRELCASAQFRATYNISCDGL